MPIAPVPAPLRDPLGNSVVVFGYAKPYTLQLQHEGEFHPGSDRVSISGNQIVRAIGPGRVWFVGQEYGRPGVWLVTASHKIAGKTRWVNYKHLQKPAVKWLNWLTSDTIIGTLDPILAHLHIEITVRFKPRPVYGSYRTIASIKRDFLDPDLYVPSSPNEPRP